MSATRKRSMRVFVGAAVLVVASGAALAACSSSSGQKSASSGSGVGPPSTVGNVAHPSEAVIQQEARFTVGPYAFYAEYLGNGISLPINAQTTKTVSGPPPRGCEGNGTLSNSFVVGKNGSSIQSASLGKATGVYNIVVYRCTSSHAEAAMMQQFEQGMHPDSDPGVWFTSGTAPAGAQVYLETGPYALQQAKSFGWGSQAHLPATEVAEDVVVKRGRYVWGVWSMAPSQALMNQFLASFQIQS